jgi:hypothetical protein
MLVPASLIGLTLLIGLLGILYQTSERPVDVSGAIHQVSEQKAPKDLEAVTVNNEAPSTAEVQSLLDRLSAVQSEGDLLELLRPVPHLEEKLEKFYNSNPLKFSKVSTVRLVQSVTGYKNRFYCSALYEDGSVRNCIVVRDEKGIVLDWESFVAYSDVAWEQIKSVFPREPFTVRAIRSVAEYYNHGFSSGDYQCYELTKVDSNIRFYAYARRWGSLMSQLQPIGMSDQNVEMTLRVYYPEEVIDDRLLVIDSVVSETWFVDYKK